MNKLMLFSIGIASLFFNLNHANAMGIFPPSAPTPAPAPVATPKPAPTPKPVATPQPAPQPVSQNPSSNFTALWIGKNADAPNWTIEAQDAINAYGDAMLKGTSDITSFCPMYSHLGHQDQMDFWVQLLASVAKYESSFDPTSLYVETSLGVDPVTGEQVVSAGLFQLSYQDEQNYKSVLPTGVCQFDYQADSLLAKNDIRRTILNPKNNITCAVAILNHQISRYGKIAISSGAYWSTLQPSSSHSQLAGIEKITKALSFCN